jgi:hypothetical protein
MVEHTHLQLSRLCDLVAESIMKSHGNIYAAQATAKEIVKSVAGFTFDALNEVPVQHRQTRFEFLFGVKHGLQGWEDMDEQ